MRETRGPYTVKRRHEEWRIVNRHGEVERLGFRDRPAAERLAQLMTAAEAAGNQDQKGCTP